MASELRMQGGTMKAAPKQTNPDSSHSTNEATQDSWQKQLAQTENNSKEATAQRCFLAGIPDSPRMTAQRQRIESYMSTNRQAVAPSHPSSQTNRQPNIQRLKKRAATGDKAIQMMEGADTTPAPVTKKAESFLQRKCSRCEAEENIQKKPFPELIQAKDVKDAVPNPINFEAHENSSHSHSAAIQFKLKIGAPNDIYEQEADSVADKVVKLQESEVHSSAPAIVQTKCAACEAEDKEAIQRKKLPSDPAKISEGIGKNALTQTPLSPSEPTSTITPAPKTSVLRLPNANDEELQLKEEKEEELSEISMKSFGGDEPRAPESIENSLSQSKGAGSYLPNNIRAFMEQSIGADFSAVKIHNDSNAVQMSKNLNAQAFTHGNDIYFNSGKYNPASSEGTHLLAHELAHVVQQNQGLQKKVIQRAPVDEPKKNSVIDYDKAKSDNLKSWYEQYKFYNLFKEIDVYPGSTPIAYANHVYELQIKLEEAFPGKWAAKEAGILEPAITADSVLYKLLDTAIHYHSDPTAHNGFNTKLLERLYQYFNEFESSPPPLISEYFAGVRQLEMVNRNKRFYIQFDDRGDYVRQLQAALLALNYDIGADLKQDKKTQTKEPSGVFGKGTKQAVIEFQKDSGFEGKDVDGIVGQMTLRLLDKRIGAPAFKSPSVSTGTAFAFHVPLSASDLLIAKDALKTDLLKRTLKVAFPVTEDQIDVLARSGWHWTIYKEPTQADVDVGYMQVTIGKSSYQSVMGKIDETADNKPGEPVQEKLEKQTLDLLKTGNLYSLNQKIKSLESVIASERKGDPDMHGRDINWDEVRKDEARLEALKKERQEELNRLGITLDDYEKLQTDFIGNFEKFAVLIAFRMLSDNEMQANIEAQHYAKAEEVAAIKAVLGDLSNKYNDSQKLWWEAVSLEDTAGKDKSYYSSGADYRSKNQSFHGDIDVDTSDPTRYYNDENAAAMYKALEQKPSPYFAPWQEKEKTVVVSLQDSVKKFPILAHPKLELRRNAGKDAAMADDTIQKLLLAIINGTDDEKGIKQNIEDTRKALAENHEKIWELPVVILKAQYALGVIEGVPATLIKAKQDAVANKAFWESVGLAVLGISLGLLALASGPAGWLALAASIGVGAYDAARTYSDITFKKTTANTALDPVLALGTDDPSYFWFWVSLVSIGLDVVQAAKLLKSIAKGIDLAEGVTKGLSEAKAAKELELLKAGGSSTSKGKAILKEIEEIDQALSKISSTEFAENIKLLEPLKSNPMAVVVMGEALKDKKIVKAVTALGKLVEKEMFESSLKFYAGVGRNSLDELPELMRLIKEGGLGANKRLMTELLSDPRTQRVLLDTQDPAFVLGQFEAWNKAIGAGKSQSFVSFLEAENQITKLATDTKLVDMFGESFATLSNVVKNTYIMRTVEPRLLHAFHTGGLSPELKKALEVLLNSDVLAQSTRLSSAQQRMLREIRILGGVIETQSDFSKVVSLLDNPASRRALWEGASQLAGKDKYVELILKANAGKQPAADVLDDLIRIGPMTDEGTIQSLLAPAGQKLRQALAASPEAVAVLKKCASPCLPTFVTAEQVNQVALIMSGKSKDDLLRIREFLYANRGSEDGFKSALSSLETNFADALKDIKLPVLTKPVGFTASDEALRAILNLGLPVSELNKIMAKAAAVKGGSEIITDLMRVLQFEKNVSLSHFDKLLKGLAEGSDIEFRAARHLLDEAERFANASAAGLKKFKYSGLEKADILLGRFSLTELNTLMNARWSESFVNSLYEVADKMPTLKFDEIKALITRAGGSKAPGDLGRLREILSTVKAPSTSYDEAVKIIQAADSFAADVAKAMKDPATGYDAMVKLIWGESVAVEGGSIKVTEALGKSGSDAYQTVFQLGKGDSLAKNMVSGGALSKDKWKVFRKVIDDSNIATSIKNNIIGEMWTRVNAEAYQELGYKVYREVGITNGTTLAKADIILEKGNEIIVLECKSGGATYSKGQDIIYPLLQDGKFKSVMLNGDEALAKKFADPASKIKFITARESEIIK